MSLLPLTPTEQHPDDLDPKEAAYLNWIAVGKTLDEAADLEGVKYNSVKGKSKKPASVFKSIPCRISCHWLSAPA